MTVTPSLSLVRPPPSSPPYGTHPLPSSPDSPLTCPLTTGLPRTPSQTLDLHLIITLNTDPHSYRLFAAPACVGERGREGVEDSKGIYQSSLGEKRDQRGCLGLHHPETRDSNTAKKGQRSDLSPLSSLVTVLENTPHANTSKKSHERNV